MTGLRLKQTVESMFDVIRTRSTSEELVFVCPEPGCADQSGNRSVNLKSGKTFCWRCNKGGDFVRWARFIGLAVEDEGGVVQGQPLDEMDLSVRREEDQPLPNVASVRLPEGFRYCHEHPTGLYTELIAEMANRKNLSIQDFFEAKVGYTRTSPRWEPYAIFPVMEDACTVYYQGRTYVDVPGESTKLFPTRQECPNSSKFWIYNIDELRQKGGVALAMESILNVLTMRRFFREQGITGVVPVCIFKHYLSKPQARKILEIPNLTEICLLYDHDATRLAWEKTPMLSDRVSVTVAEMPPGPGGDKNDPNDDPVSAWAAFEARERSDVLSSLRFKLEVPRPVSELVPQLVPPTNPLDDIL